MREEHGGTTVTHLGYVGLQSPYVEDQVCLEELKDFVHDAANSVTVSCPPDVGCCAVVPLVQLGFKNFHVASDCKSQWEGNCLTEHTTPSFYP